MRWVGGEGGGLRKAGGGGQPVGLPNSRGGIIRTAREWDSGPAVHRCCLCPLTSLPRRGRRCTLSHSDNRELRRGPPTPSDVGNGRRGPGGFRITKWYPSGVQHAQLFCHFFLLGEGGKGILGCRTSEQINMIHTMIQNKHDATVQCNVCVQLPMCSSVLETLTRR